LDESYAPALVGWEDPLPNNLTLLGSHFDPRSALAARRLFSKIYDIPKYIFITVYHWEQGRRLAKAGPVYE